MNITLRDVYQTSMDGDRFWSVIHEEALYVLLPSLYAFQVFFVGTRACAYPQMKCFPVPDMLFDAVKEKQVRARETVGTPEVLVLVARGACVRVSYACSP
ncbi:hypothetical protein EDD16DRAFT_1583435 [Pisolithus croceorrhizus]|nr:hypothetical protein EV401DRAFT_1982852 [Pisolithus croceorrhizus]KAI6119060.1 hypothetical protein EDD16DRAFT_1583435 [Pisolithus croceorrhizus]